MYQADLPRPDILSQHEAAHVLLRSCHSMSCDQSAKAASETSCTSSTSYRRHRLPVCLAQGLSLDRWLLHYRNGTQSPRSADQLRRHDQHILAASLHFATAAAVLVQESGKSKVANNRVAQRGRDVVDSSYEWRQPQCANNSRRRTGMAVHAALQS